MFSVAHLIPTGVGASFGGYAGDASPVARLLASVVDRLVTHPNALNAANFFAKPENALYVEGLALDAWISGRWALRPVRRQRVGLLIDRAIAGMPPGTLESLLNAANAVHAVHGVDLVGYRLTERPLECAMVVGPSGAASGEIGAPGALLEGARALQAAGATAVAILADLGPYPAGSEEAYREGRGVDPIGGLEALLSHLVVERLGIPAAHAPIFPFDPAPQPVVDPRAAAEYLGQTYLPCVLQGLAGHPELVPAADARPGDLAAGAVDALVVPAGCLGGAGTLAAHARGVPIVAVRENQTVLQVDAERLGWDRGVHTVASYLEAAGLLAAWRLGIDERSLRRPLAPIAPL